MKRTLLVLALLALSGAAAATTYCSTQCRTDAYGNRVCYTYCSR